MAQTAAHGLQRRLPTWAAGWIQLIADGDLGRIDPAWAQWRLRRGELISPDGWSFRPGEVATIAFRNQKIRFLKDDLERRGSNCRSCCRVTRADAAMIAGQRRQYDYRRPSPDRRRCYAPGCLSKSQVYIPTLVP